MLGTRFTNHMKIFILFCLVLISSTHGGIWVPNPVQISPEGIIYFDLPFPGPVQMASNASEEGFFPVSNEGGLNFKRVLAVSEKDLDFNLVEYSPGLILPPENQAGYLVVENSKRRPRLRLEDATLIEPGFFSKRFSPSLTAIKELPEINEIPSEISDFKKWSLGDSIAFQKNTNLLVNIAYGAKNITDFGVVGSISSSWNILVSLISENKNLVVKVVYKKIPGIDYSFNKGAFGEKVNLFKLWGETKTFSFIFDLSNSKEANPLKIVTLGGSQKIIEKANALMAYQEALKGNLVIANLLSQRKVYGVRKIFEEEEESRFKNQNVTGGLKVAWKFDPSFKMGASIFSTKSKSFEGNLLLENIVGFFSQEIENSIDSKKIRIFTNYLQQINHLDQAVGISERRYGASFKAVRFLKEIEKEDVLNQLQATLFKIGFSKELLSKKISVAKIENMEMDLDLSLSNLAIDVLMNLPGEYPENVLINEANKSVVDFFKTTINANQEICDDYHAKDINQCIFLVKTKTLQATTNAYRALVKMKEQRMEKNYTEFNKSFGDFGRGFVENKFAMMTFLKLIQFHLSPDFEKTAKERMVMDDGKLIKAPFIIRIQIKGSNMPPISRVMRSDFND